MSPEPILSPVVYDVVVVPTHEAERLRRLGLSGYAVAGVTSMRYTRLVFDRIGGRAIEADEIVSAVIMQRSRLNTGNEAHR